MKAASRRQPSASELLGLRRFEAAEERFRAIVAASPGDALAWAGLGDALQGQGRLDDACGAYERSVSLDPGRYPPWWGLGCARLRLMDHALAVQAFQQATALRPESPGAWHNLGKSRYELGLIEDAIDAMRRAADLSGGSALALRGVAVGIPGDPRADAAAIASVRRDWALRVEAESPIGAPVRPCRPARPEGPLRVGYLSDFFHRGNWMKPVWPLINRHDRARFSVCLLSGHPRAALDGGYAGQPDDTFVDLSGMGAADAVRRIADLDLDILVDLNSFSSPDRFAVLTRRPARRLVGWFNTFATSGLDIYDAVVADSVVAPMGEASGFVEPILRVPGCHLAFEVHHPAPEVVPPPVLTQSHLTFGCFAQQYKMTEESVLAYAQILKGCPGARLLLKSAVFQRAANRDWVRERFAAHGVPRECLLIEEPEPHFDFLKAYGRVDVALETFPYGGATTAMEALWQGVPVLAFPGDRWASRLAATILRHAGLDDWVVPDLQAMIRTAQALHHDPQTPARLAALRSGMRNQLRNSPACDTAGLTRAMEDLYRDIVASPSRFDPGLPVA